MKRTLIVLTAVGLLVAACGPAAADTRATVAAQVNATLAAMPPQQVTVPVLVTQQVIVTQEVIVTQQVPVEVPVTVVVSATQADSGQPQPTAEPGATEAPAPTDAPVVNNNGQDPMAGANVTPIIDERFDFLNKYYWWVFGPDISTSGEGKITNETYVLSSKQVENYEWTFDGKKLQNFYVSAKAQIPDEQCKSGDHWGLVFRYKDNTNFYMFGVSCDSKYSLLKRTPAGFDTILPPTDSTAINKFGRSNVLGVRAVGDQISLYVNDQFLVTVTDGTFSEGLIGMYVRTFLTPKMTVVFDDIKAYIVGQ
jgi:hypothetical protein